MKAALIPFLVLPLAAQAPAGLDAAFFKGDARTIMVTCADKARVGHVRDGRMLAEFGRTYLAAGDRKRAEDAFQRAVQADPKDGGIRFLVGYAWLRNGHKPEALAAFEAMAKADPKAGAWFQRAAVSLLGAGLEKEAVGYMEKVHTQDPKNAGACVEFGRAALRARLRSVAADWFSRALLAAPGDEAVLNDIALAYADKGEAKP